MDGLLCSRWHVKGMTLALQGSDVITEDTTVLRANVVIGDIDTAASVELVAEVTDMGV